MRFLDFNPFGQKKPSELPINQLKYFKVGFQICHNIKFNVLSPILCSVADPDPFDTDLDPAFHFDTDLDPAFQFDTDPTVLSGSGSGSLLFQRGNVPKTVLFIHLYLIFLVSRSNRT
jgi:hypothetical protein